MDLSPPYVLSLLGRAELRDSEGKVVPLRTRKTFLVLAMLAFTPGRSWRRMEIGAAIWEDSDAKGIQEGLRTALSALRKILPAETLEAKGEWISLLPGRIVAPLPEDDGGEFLPGFENAWVDEQRLRLRARFVDHALAQARRERSLEWVERACAADPLNAEAATFRIELLGERGRAQEAMLHGDAFRARTLRELGYVTEIRPAPPTPEKEHPLVAAAQWALDRDPAEACALLAGTQTQWMTLPNEVALTFHRRVLAATPRASRERRLVEAGACYLTMQSGRLGDQLDAVETSYREAIALGEGPTTARFGESLAYAHLSKGDFETALRYAREGVELAALRRDPTSEAQAQMHLSIIEFHAGEVTASYPRAEEATREIEKHGSPMTIASFKSVQMGSWLYQGQIDRAADLFESIGRWIGAIGGERQNVWLLACEALLYERAGDLAASQKAYERFRAAAPDAGQSAVAQADDGLLRINCKLREYDEAALAMARATVYRRSLGTVRSLAERAVTGSSVRLLKERLTPADLEAAFRRAASVV